MKQSEINNFKRKYLDPNMRNEVNVIKHDPNTTPEHRRIVNDICEWAMTNKLSFYTRAYTQWGEIVDIVIPSLVRPLIEVRHSELVKTKEYLSDYDGLRVYVDTNDPWRLL